MCQVISDIKWSYSIVLRLAVSECFILKIMSNAEKLAEEFESGEADFDREVDSVGGSGKHRTKLEQHQHKKEHLEGDTRRIVNNAMAEFMTSCDMNSKRFRNSRMLTFTEKKILLH
ncbi:Isoprene synthase,chloroplastic [Trichinella pseudospiralis]